MITLAFLICLPNGMCQAAGPPYVYSTMSECETMATMIIAENMGAISRGEAPVHSVVHKCINWGEPL